ncbi:unnamed protein product [Mytilus edulis]|uniref:DUF4371 domain-containing protein n=1 Tax=Mytilus edulis TaxID=6550 RepID=A0A8S3TKM5_MYTED|nr:unnamed protein product [Mytilus edulis]
MGCSYLNHLQKGGNANYESQRTLQEMLHIIAEQIAAPILQDICKSRYYSILIDVTTDIAVIKQMTILARYITENNQLPTEHLIGLGSDGASFMVGRKSGTILGGPQLKMKEVLNTRWLSHDRAKIDVDFTLIETLVSATQITITKLIKQPGHHMQSLLTCLDNLSEYGVRLRQSNIDNFKRDIYQPYLENVVQMTPEPT